MKHLVIYCLLWLFVALAIITATAIAKSSTLVTQLIYHDSVLSPYYDAAATIPERASCSIRSSMARHRNFKSTRTDEGRSPASDSDYIRGDLLPDGSGRDAGFLVSFFIGEPPVHQLAVMDTGSSLLWVQCDCSANCNTQFKGPIYHPSHSSTHATISCMSSDCDPGPIHGNCSSQNYCTYYVHYYSGETNGYLAKEKLRFKTSDGGMIDVPNVTFGCGTKNYGLRDQMTGVLGLGPQKFSLTTKLGSKFSYCIGNLSDPEYPSNQLILGEEAIMEGVSTPIELHGRYGGEYHLTLEGISVANKRLPLNPRIFRRTQSGKGGVIIDSGSGMSYLVQEAYEHLRFQVSNVIGNRLKQFSHPDDRELLCYNGIISRDLQDFPGVTFHFGDGADFKLYAENLFIPTDTDKFCMAISMSDTLGDEYSTIGVAIQQYYNIGYDLAAMKLHFARIDCQLLED